MPILATSASTPYDDGSLPKPPKKATNWIPEWVKKSAQSASTLAVSGAVSGGLFDVLAHPIYRLSNQVMMQGANPSGLKYTSLFDGFKQIIKADGSKGLFRGLPAVLQMGPVGSGLFFMGMFGTQEAYKGSTLEDWAKANQKNDQIKMAVNSASGLMGQLFAQLVFTPSSVVSECQQAKGFNPKFETLSLRATLREIYRLEGMRGFYKGLIPQAISFGSCHAISVPVYQELKARFAEKGYDSRSADICAGMLGYAFGSVATQPLAVAKTRLQVAKINPELFPERNTASTLAGIVRREGVKALFDGTVARGSFVAFRLGVGIPVAGMLKTEYDKLTADSPTA